MAATTTLFLSLFLLFLARAQSQTRPTPAAPPPASDFCNRIFLSYTYTGGSPTTPKDDPGGSSSHQRSEVGLVLGYMIEGADLLSIRHLLLIQVLYQNVALKLKEAILYGVSLEDIKKERFNEVEQESEKLAQKFEENILDATKNYEKVVMDKKEIEGLPFTTLALAAETAISKGYDNVTADAGPWIITLDGPIYRSVMQHAHNRSLREDIYRAYVSRASEGPLNKTPIIERILELRLEKAKLLGHVNYAEFSFEAKMATLDKARDLIEKLHNASWCPAIKEELRDYAREQGANEANNLNQWDINFWSERLRESKYDLNEIGSNPDSDGRLSVQRVALLSSHDSEVWQMEWDMSGMTLASTGSDGVVRLWQSNVNGEWHEQAILTPTS
ncbi:hypothetical protein CASFOL_001612 [Castilleja foliolosa]|uniref:Peptidase M3A/M3B catalytic domain-containing protein n=1 Tax=Castilleja foliolosa TaxID=1961234 RepID=A0ABD3EKA1_9LAMI